MPRAVSWAFDIYRHALERPGGIPLREHPALAPSGLKSAHRGRQHLEGMCDLDLIQAGTLARFPKREPIDPLTHVPECMSVW